MGVRRNSRIAIILAVAGSVIFGTSGFAGAASPVSAAHAQKKRTTSDMQIKYHNSWLFKSHPLKRCITLATHGTIKYTAVTHPNPRDPPPTITFKNIKLTDPVVTATVTYLRKSGSCGSRVSLSKISLGQHWTGYSCSFNPSLSVSFPWGVSVGGWPVCGGRKQASYTTSYGSGSFYKQSNSGSPTQFGNVTIDAGQTAPSYGVFASVVAYVGRTSDSYGASNGSGAKKAGLKKP
jgi:hypothetical protein